jgi:DNA-binding CsgD family transcriptional regulator
LRQSAAIQHIQHIAALGLPPEVAVPQMVDALQFFIPSVTNTFAWLDENYMPMRFYQRELIPSAIEAFMGQTPELIAKGEPNMHQLARAPADYGNWWAFTADPKWEMSVMRNELFRPYNIGNNMDFSVTDRGIKKAILTVNREPGSPVFTQSEINAVLSLRGHFLHAMAAPEMSSPDCDTVLDDNIATAIFDRDGTLVISGPNADLLLYQLQSGELPHQFVCHSAPPAVQSVMASLEKARNGHLTAAPSSDVRTRWGDIRVAAHMMTADKLVIVTLQRLESRIVRRMRRLAQLDLSPRERRVALAMCEMTSAADIARTTGLTESSFREYAKRIYGRLDVQGRDGVRVLLDS